MPTLLTRIAIPGCALLLAACAAAPKEAAQSPAEAQATAAAPISLGEGVTASGPAQDCVGLTQIREAKVISDSIIDFHLIDGRILRNVLPHSCPQLGFERAFSYSTSLSQLCSTDIITVIIQGAGPMRGASCGLGKFQPVTIAAQ